MVQGKKVRMNIVQRGPESSGARIDNCSREGVYLKDGYPGEGFKKIFHFPFPLQNNLSLDSKRKAKLTNICGTDQNELLFLA